MLSAVLSIAEKESEYKILGPRLSFCEIVCVVTPRPVSTSLLSIMDQLPKSQALTNSFTSLLGILPPRVGTSPAWQHLVDQSYLMMCWEKYTVSLLFI